MNDKLVLCQVLFIVIYVCLHTVTKGSCTRESHQSYHKMSEDTLV